MAFIFLFFRLPLLQKLPLLQRLPLLQMPLQQVVMLVVMVVTVAPEVMVVTVTEAAELGGNFASANASQ